MSYNFRKGQAEIEDSASRKGGGSFSFVPRIRWREDAETKYILVLTPVEEVVRVQMHEWIPVGKGEKANGEEYTRWEDFIARTDPAIGEDSDELTDRLERDAKDRHVGIAVELEPIVETVNGRKKVKGFVAKTEVYTRTVDDKEEEVTQPAIGLIVESSKTFWGTMGSFDQSQGPLVDLPMEVIRRGKDQNTRYDGIPFIDVPVDLSPVIEYVDGLSYLADDLDEVIQAIDATQNEQEAAQVVADALITKRLSELADAERYQELVTPLKLEDMPKKFGSGGKRGSGSSNGRTQRPRPARSSRRQETEDSPSGEAASEAQPAAEPTKDDRFAALKARVEGRK